jgi:hypothetical protein
MAVESLGGLGILLKEVVGSTELESVTSCVSSRRSNQLSYEPLRSGVAIATCNGQDNMAISLEAIFRSIVGRSLDTARKSACATCLVSAVVDFELPRFARRDRQNHNRQRQQSQHGHGGRCRLGRSDQ